MSVKIRLKRMGAKKKPFYRIVVADSRSPRDGKFIEELGYFDPLKDPAIIKIDGKKARKWISNGAQPTDTVKALLKKSGALDATDAAEPEDVTDTAVESSDVPVEVSDISVEPSDVPVEVSDLSVEPVDVPVEPADAPEDPNALSE
jgi:small subunit ribosomal protein S16